MDNIGIIGQGFVGTAVRETMKHTFRVKAFDRIEELCADYEGETKIHEGPYNTIKSLVEDCEVIFVCVPTPMFENGECDLRIVESVIEDIAKEADFQSKNIITIIKSTIPPGTTEKLNGLSNRVSVTFSPEFLTEANAIKDFENQTRVVLGIDYIEYVDPISEIFQLLRR